MREAAEHNRRAWDEIHRRRTGVMEGRLGIRPEVRERLPALSRKRVLHLQCATGESSEELTALGARVVAVDISGEALEVARARAPEIEWVQADVQALPAALRQGGFDLVYTAEGIVHWLHDLDAWSSGIAQALRTGGVLLLYDGHPAGACVDGQLRWTQDYFTEDVLVGAGWAHFDLPGEPAREEKWQRLWPLGRVVTAVVRAGLRVRELVEYPAEPGAFRGHDARVPGAFSLIAEKR